MQLLSFNTLLQSKAFPVPTPYKEPPFSSSVLELELFQDVLVHEPATLVEPVLHSS